MRYYARICPKCHASNHPTMQFCGRCGGDLPTEKTETDKKPIGPLYAPRAALPAEAAGDPPETEISLPRIGRLLLLIGLLAVGYTALHLYLFGDPPRAAHTPAARAASDPDEVRRYQMARLSVAHIQDRLRDPASLQIHRLLASRDGWTVCVDYGARNGFGGMGREAVINTRYESLQDASAWAQYCTGPEMVDMRSAWP